MSHCHACGLELPPRGHRGNPRKWCSNSCRLWASRNPGEKRVDRFCEGCGSDISDKNQSARWCSDSCRFRSSPRPPRPCDGCGDPIKSFGPVAARRRALKLGVASESYSLPEIAVRDGYRCGLCNRKVNMRLVGPYDMAPSIDHIVPLSRGGDDTTANVQLAHWLCNIRKGNRVGEVQLALVG